MDSRKSGIRLTDDDQRFRQYAALVSARETVRYCTSRGHRPRGEVRIGTSFRGRRRQGAGAGRGRSRHPCRIVEEGQVEFGAGVEGDFRGVGSRGRGARARAPLEHVHIGERR